MDCFEQSDTVMYVMFIVFQNNCKSSPKTDIFSWKFWNFRSTWNRYPNPCHLTGHVVTSRSTPTLIHSTPNRQSSGRQQANQVYYRAGLDISRSVNDNLELVDDADDNIRSLSPASFTIRSTPRIIHPTPSRHATFIQPTCQSSLPWSWPYYLHADQCMRTLSWMQKVKMRILVFVQWVM